MTQIILDINEKLLQTLQQQASESGTTPQQWLENLVLQHLSPEWPNAVRVLIGAWAGEFPAAEALRRPSGTDLPRESL
jgi:hypothetical protein